MSQAFPVFIRSGDLVDEVAALVRELGGESAAGLHRQMYVARAGQTVVMTSSRDAPLAASLRSRGWSEPREDS